MSAKHTRAIRPIDPGPWEWNELSPDDPEWELCEVWQADGTEEGKLICSGGLGIANARLIATSPELLALAVKLAEWDKKWPKGHDRVGISEREMNAICAEAHLLIAKATGAQP